LFRKKKKAPVSKTPDLGFGQSMELLGFEKGITTIEETVVSGVITK